MTIIEEVVAHTIYDFGFAIYDLRETSTIVNRVPLGEAQIANLL
jgi:hypothetical protein